MKPFIQLAEQGFIPDWLIRFGIRRLAAERLDLANRQTLEQRRAEKQALLQHLRQSPLAVHTDDANQQHYELPPAYFEQVLGKHKKYSACYFPTGAETLEEAEAAALEQITQRAQITDGMQILELGCGWGSLSLWLAQHFPGSQILAISNSNPQREWIQDACRERNLTNLTVETRDINTFQTDRRFDRVVSIEMFEHLRNYQLLFARIASWLKDGGKLFAHIFTHKNQAYLFETEGASNWMGRYFFTGGIMPSDDLFHYFQEDLILEEQWQLGGEHYRQTAMAWLRNQDHNRDAILRIFADTYGEEHKEIWFNRWRMFYLACAEVFGYKGGTEWGISHYRFKKRGD